MTQGRQLYRSRDALIAGVCAGVADYFSVDPLVVRILAAAFTLASGGLLGLAYLAMWIVVPKAPKIVKPLEVKPQSVHSDTYGTVDFGSRYGSTGQGPSRSNTPAQAAGWRYSVPSYTGAAHVPPEPPAAAPLKRVPQPVVHHPVDPPKEASEAGVRAALWLGSFLLFTGIVAMAVTFVRDIAWWQYAPLFFVILGIAGMVVPGTPGRRMRKFVEGLACFCIGSMALTMSLGIVAWESIVPMLVYLWPLLLMTLAFAVFSATLKSSMMNLLAGACFAVFCTVGVLWYSIPGPTTEIVFMAPYGREYHIQMLLKEREFDLLNGDVLEWSIRL